MSVTDGLCGLCHGWHGPQDMCPRGAGLDRVNRGYFQPQADGSMKWIDFELHSPVCIDCEPLPASGHVTDKNWCPDHGAYPCDCKKEKEMSPMSKVEHAQKQAQQKATDLCPYCGQSGRAGHAADCGGERARKQAQQKATATQELLAERETTHGSFGQNARYGQALRKMFRESPGWVRADEREREVLDYLAGKLSRILSGKPHPQHWEDIAGYAELAANPDLQR